MREHFYNHVNNLISSKVQPFVKERKKLKEQNHNRTDSTGIQKDKHKQSQKR